MTNCCPRAETVTPVTSCPLVTSWRMRDSTAPLSSAPFSPRENDDDDDDSPLQSLRYRTEVSRLRAPRNDIEMDGTPPHSTRMLFFFYLPYLSSAASTLKGMFPGGATK